MKKYVAEFIGTFTLVLFGCGTAVIAGKQVGFLGIALAFGFALVAMAYGIGPISGCHINPAVSLGIFAAGRMTARDLGGYIVGQLLGGVGGAAIVWLIASGTPTFGLGLNGLGQNGWGSGYLGEYGLGAAITFEFFATVLFLIVILGSTEAGPATPLAGLAIGITLTVIHIFGINITGVSVNPARSLGPAVFVGGRALAQLWLFLLVPSIAGIVAGVFYRTHLLGVEQARKKTRVAAAA